MALLARLAGSAGLVGIAGLAGLAGLVGIARLAVLAGLLAAAGCSARRKNLGTRTPAHRIAPEALEPARLPA